MRRKIQVKERQPQFCVVTGITFTQVDAWFGNTMRDLKMDLIYPKDAGKKYPCCVDLRRSMDSDGSFCAFGLFV